MQYSKIGLKQLTEAFESCRLVAYPDVRGVWTIGWGHTGPEVCEGLVWTQVQADAQLLKDIQRATDSVNRSVWVPITQGEFDALVDFTFNVGCAAFQKSTMLKMINAGAYQAAAKEFEKWDYAGGQQIAGLLRRRKAEETVFNL
jgi:lysozyme